MDALKVTKLETISNNHISLECVCGHGSMISVAELLKTLKPDTTIFQVAGNARCRNRGRKGATDFRLHYVCKSRDDLR
jgi:hypothetical protein